MPGGEMMTPDPEPEPEPRMVLGQRIGEPFRMVEDGDVMRVVRGFQGGGSHIFATFQFELIDREIPTVIRWRVTLNGTEVTLANAESNAIYRDGDAEGEFEIQDQFVPFNRVADELDGEIIRVEFELIDAEDDTIIYAELDQTVRLQV